MLTCQFHLQVKWFIQSQGPRPIMLRLFLFFSFCVMYVCDVVLYDCLSQVSGNPAVSSDVLGVWGSRSKGVEGGWGRFVVCIWCFELRSKAVSKAQVHQMTMTRFELLGLEQGSAMVSSGRLMMYLLSFDSLIGLFGVLSEVMSPLQTPSEIRHGSKCSAPSEVRH